MNTSWKKNNGGRNSVYPIEGVKAEIQRVVGCKFLRSSALLAKPAEICRIAGRNRRSAPLGAPSICAFHYLLQFDLPVWITSFIDWQICGICYKSHKRPNQFGAIPRGG